VCQPSRASILTGLLPLTHGVYIYSTDHGEMLGEHGLWWKSAMYESAVAVPLIVAGPDVPAGRVVGANAMLVDIFPSVLEAVGAHPSPEDRDLSLPNRVMITTRVLRASRS
jgi:choline-sulfatase